MGKKIAILGTENSHALAFAKLLKDPKYADIELCGIYGYDTDANMGILDIWPGIESAPSPYAFLGRVDGVVITARHGTHHYEYGLPYIKAGVPAFIDKPFTVEQHHADELIAVAETASTPLCGGSCLKFARELEPLRAAVLTPVSEWGNVIGGHFTAPVDLDNPYGGFFFYTQHLVQMVLRVFGGGIDSVRAAGNGDTITALFRYPAYDVSGLYGPGVYSASIAFQQKLLYTEIGDVIDLFDAELLEFADMLRTGSMPGTYAELAYPVTVLQALYKALETGREIRLHY